MKKLYSLLRAALFLIATIVVGGCDYEEISATDLITGEVDLEEVYAKANMEVPTLLGGKIIDRATNLPIQGAKIVARRNFSEQQYSTTSKADGTFKIYVEGYNDYVVKADKEGFERSYFRDSQDTIISISSYWNSYDLKLNVKDNTPTFKVNFQNSYTTNISVMSLTFNGTLLVGSSNSYCYFFNKQADYLNYTYQSNSYDFISHKDTLFYMGNSNSKTISKIGQKTGKVYSTVYAQIPTTTISDMDVFNNDIWLINGKQIMKLSQTGSLISTIDLQAKIFDLNLVGIAHNKTHVFVLNKENSSDNSNPGYSIYKIDPTAGTIVSKGILPEHLEDLDLRGLTFDNTSFWTASNGYYSNGLVKFSIVE
jgi:hypothetical protein